MLKLKKQETKPEDGTKLEATIDDIKSGDKIIIKEENCKICMRKK